MTWTTSWRGAGILALAVAGPPAIVWSSARIAHAFQPPPPAAAPRVANFSDHITRPAVPASRTLPAGTVLWQGKPGDGAPFFSHMIRTHDTIVLLSEGRLVAIDASSGQVLRDVAVQEHEQLSTLELSSLVQADRPRQVWTYSWNSGLLRLYDLTADLTPVETVHAQPSLNKGLKWVGNRLVASGPFENELVRVFGPGQTTSPRFPEARELTMTGTLGTSLFPGLVTNLVRSLNMTQLDVAPAGDKVAVACQWNDRINIYDLKTMALERSIAGPVVTKLDFSVVNVAEKPVFTLSDESRYSYLDVAVTDRDIVALYSGREMRKHRTSLGLGEQLHIFTWDGRLRGIWYLKEPLQQIALDPATHTLYGLRWKPSMAVVAINIQQVLDSQPPTPAHPGT